MFDLSPLCAFVCVLNWLTCYEAKSHWLHLFGFFRYVFSNVSSNGPHEKRHSHIRCVCLNFLHCTFSKVWTLWIFVHFLQFRLFEFQYFLIFSDTFQWQIFFRNQIRYSFRYQNFSKPNPILFLIPNFLETCTDIFFDTKIFETDTDTIQKNGKVSKPRSFETEMSHSAVCICAPFLQCE